MHRYAVARALVWAVCLVGVSVSAPAQLEDTKIAFASNTDGDWDIYVINYGGSGLANLTSISPSIDWRLRWSPDATQIAFASDRDGDFDIYTMDADGANVRNVTQATDVTGAHDTKPDWSPDGSEIVFVSDRYNGSRFEVCRIDALGASPPVRLTHEAVIYTADPDWSPDGSQIAFRRGTPTSIWRMDRDGGGQVQLSLHATVGDEEPDWSPDGRRIVFGRKPTHGAKHLYVMDADVGESETVATQYTFDGYSEYPAWSPDGSEIAHYRNGGVYLTEATPGAMPTLLVARGTMPAWSPFAGPGSGIPVTVDIMPGSTRNPVTLRGNGVIAVAVLGTGDFDATAIDDASVRLGPAGASIAHKTAHRKDVDGDGQRDWLGHFRRRDIGLDMGATEATLSGLTRIGAAFAGADHVVVVGKASAAPSIDAADSRGATWADVKRGIGAR